MGRWEFYERYGHMLWAVFFLATFVVVVAMLIFGCGGKGKEPDVPKLLSCAEKVVQLVNETPDCADIQRKVDELLSAQAECFEALTGERAIQWSCGDGGAVR